MLIIKSSLGLASNLEDIEKLHLQSYCLDGLNQDDVINKYMYNFFWSLAYFNIQNSLSNLNVELELKYLINKYLK